MKNSMTDSGVGSDINFDYFNACELPSTGLGFQVLWFPTEKEILAMCIAFLTVIECSGFSSRDEFQRALTIY